MQRPQHNDEWPLRTNSDLLMRSCAGKSEVTFMYDTIPSSSSMGRVSKSKGMLPTCPLADTTGPFGEDRRKAFSWVLGGMYVRRG